MYALIVNRIGPALLAILVAVLALVAIQTIERSSAAHDIGFFNAYGHHVIEMVRWFGGAPVDTVGPTVVLRMLPTTLVLAGGSLLLALVLSTVTVALEKRWPYSPWALIPGKVLGTLSYLPAVVLGFLVFIYYARYIEPGRSPVGHSQELSDAMKMLVSIGVLGIGNGVFQDLKDGITHDLREVTESDFLQAVRARGESVLPYMVRALSVPLLVRSFALLPRFVGAAIPFELIFILPGVGIFTFNYIRRFLDYGNGTIYPVAILVIILGVLVTLSSLTADLLRFQLDPRQRSEEKA